VNGTRLTYLVMPFRPEGSLVEWLRRKGTAELLSPQEVAQIINQTAKALQHAHDRQIIHQDVKPSNLLIRERREDPHHPDILLTDFGIAKSASATSSMSQVIRGTPTYMAPEQWEGHPIFATDQYALAIMAYELLTGRPPFQGGTVQMMYQHLNVPSGPPSAINASLTAEVDRVVLHALAKKPQGRFASVSAFANAFRQAVQGTNVPTNEKTPSPNEAYTNKSSSVPVTKSPSNSANADVISDERVHRAVTMGADAPNAKQRIALSNSTPGSGVNPPTFVDREFPRPRKGRWLLAMVLVGLALVVVSVSTWLIFSLNAGNFSRTTLETASTPTPTPSPTNTPVTTGIVSPSGSPIASSAAAIITNVQTSNGIDSNLLPTQVTSAFSLNQVIDVTFNIHFIQPGTIEAKFYADKQPLQSYTNTLQWNDGNNSNGVLNPAGSGTYSSPTKQGAVELYWCPQFDCSNEQLAAFTTFTVS
jgi:serine/threonine protein kinase